jgi:pimeloyl-ACP methyl ester carboxylesterase
MKQVYPSLLFSLVAFVPLLCQGQQPAVAITDNAPATQEVEFRSADTTLSGTLVVPSKMIAAVVLVHGSDRTPRMTYYAQALARRGVATLTYDKRGVGKSGGVYAGPEVGTNNVDAANLDLLAGDASAAIGELVHRISSPRTPVGLIGFSQGGWIVPLAAVRTPDVKYMILWSGPLVTTLEQLRFQYLTNGKADFWDHHTESEVREHIRSDPDRSSFVATDPVESLRKLSIPGLWIYGDRDIQVPVRLSIERLEALAATGKPFEYNVIANSGHAIPFDQALSATMEWLLRTVVK